MKHIERETHPLKRVRCVWLGGKCFPWKMFSILSFVWFGRIGQVIIWAKHNFPRVENNFPSWRQGSCTFRHYQKFHPSQMTKTLFLSLQTWREDLKSFYVIPLIWLRCIFSVLSLIFHTLIATKQRKVNLELSFPLFPSKRFSFQPNTPWGCSWWIYYDFINITYYP